MKKNLSLYIHMPFYERKCEYCGFNSKVGTDQEKAIYVKDLFTEIKMRAKEYAEYFSVDIIFFGGGTPSFMPANTIRDVLSYIYRYFSVKNDAEITVEVNPNTITNAKIREYIISGVNRFSIGLQTTNEKILKAMGRTHTVQDFDNAIERIRDQGISNINADLIIGYPGQTEKDVENAVKHLISLKIPHVSCYMLQVEEGTKLYKRVKAGLENVVPDDKVIKMYNKMLSILRANGYARYEFSNFAKPGFQCTHNQTYWDRNDYLGFGVSAHSYVSGVRFSNTDNVQLYHERLSQEKLATEIANELSKEEKQEEFVMLALRTEKGLNTKDYEKEFGENFLSKNKNKLAVLIKGGFVTLSPEGVIKATDKGFLVLNRIIYELI